MISLKDIAGFSQDLPFQENQKVLDDSYGGVLGLEQLLRTDFKNGLNGKAEDINARKENYGKNEFDVPDSDSWFDMFVEALQDTTVIVLIVAAVVSLIVGTLDDPKKGWIEGVAILIAVVVVAVVTATNNYNKELQFRKLNAVKDDVQIGVIRAGVSTSIDVKEVVVGDILVLNAGDKIPADGLMVSGSDVTVNESSLTGESDDCKKDGPSNSKADHNLLSGTSLSTGYAHMVVTAVGTNSRWGKTKAKLVAETVETPLQEKLNTLAGQIGNGGMAAAGATFIAMMAIWFAFPNSRAQGVTLLEYVIKAFIMGVTIVVVAVPEGLPLAVTLSLAYSTQKMMKDNNLIRVLAACETMGNATNICSDKTGTLTQNRMTVVASWLAGTFNPKDATSQDVSESLKFLISEGVSVNSTANLMKVQGEQPIVLGSKTEGALLNMIETEYSWDYVASRATFDSSRGDQLITFSSLRKRMSTVLLNNYNKKVGISYTKGAAEVILSLSTKFVSKSGKVEALTANIRAEIAQAISSMAKATLRTIALAHREISTGDQLDPESLESDLVLDAVFGIKDPLRPDVPDAVRACQEAGIFVRMVTGDNIETAKAIAEECGILTKGGIAMEGPQFRQLSPQQLDKILPTLQVLARSSPNDKHTLVTRLNGHALPSTKEEWEALHPDKDFEKDKDLVLPGYAEEWQQARVAAGGVGEVVGVTGDGTNDGPALKAADVGLSMGLCGTEVAKEASDIVILDDNFSSIVKSVMWGRSVFDNIQKFLQFQLTVNVVALTLTFVSAITGNEPPLNAVMMLWVNLIMDTMGALALGTEPPSPTLLSRRPYKRNASLVSNKMLRHIGVQFLFQMGLLVYLLLIGAPHFGVHEDSLEHLTIIFNTFVFCQVFNEMNARSIDDSMNVFKGMFKNPLFIAIIIFTVVAQYGIVEYGGDFVRTAHLTEEQWIKCILLGSLSLPLGGLMRLIPVRNSQSDLAEVSELIKVEAKKHKSHPGQTVTLSFFVWLAVVLVIPVLTYQHFEVHWQPYVNLLLQQK